LQALREAGTEATRSTVERREETFLVLEVFREVVGAFVEMGDPFTVVDTFLDDEDSFTLVEVAFLEEEVTFLEVIVVLLVEVAFLEVTVIFFVEVDALTVKVLLIVEVARLAWWEEEEAGRNIWAIRLSKFTRGRKESRERR
jgi:hypothetical protein